MSNIGLSVGKWCLCKHLKADGAEFCCWASALCLCVHTVFDKTWARRHQECNNIQTARGGENCRGTNRERADKKNNVQNENNPLESVMCALVWVEYVPREVKCAVIRLGQCDILRQQLSCCTHSQPPLEIRLFFGNYFGEEEEEEEEGGCAFFSCCVKALSDSSSCFLNALAFCQELSDSARVRAANASP